MKTAKVLDFPYSRIKKDTEAQTAKILYFPGARAISPAEIMALPMVVAAAWLAMFGL